MNDDVMLFAQLEVERLARQVELLEHREVRRHSHAQAFIADPSKPSFFVADEVEDDEDYELAVMQAFPPSDWWR
jgi:hypothetical protein